MQLKIISPCQSKSVWQRRQLPLLAAIILLTLATLACALIGPGSRPAPNRIARLPTLTRTPLPPLTPTPTATSPTEAGVISPTLVPPSTVISSSQTAPLSAEPAVISPPPAVPPPSDTSASLATGNQDNNGPLLTALVGLNVRVGPGLDYAVVSKLAQGQSAQIVGKNPEGTWWQIIYPPGSGSPAWVSADTQYSTVSGVEAVQIAQLPSPPPPTTTPTPLPTIQATATPLPTNVSDAQLPLTSTPSTSNTPMAGPTATPLPGPPGWTFTSVRVYPDDDDSLLLYGNVVNNTGTLQALESITGAFYDGQGEVVSDDDNVYAYWPVNEVPPGSSVPFELVAEDIDDDVADFKLSAEAEPSDDTPRQDFQFSDVQQGTEDNGYCVSGKVQKPSDDLDQYLVIALILYDAQDNIVKFVDYGQFDAGEGVGEEDTAFKLCVDPPYQDVVRYELRAWGR